MKRSRSGSLPSSKKRKLDETKKVVIDPQYKERLNSDQYKAFERCFLGGGNLFITGQAGTGKTHLIMQIKRCAEEFGKTIAVTASTGRAAVNLEASTFHHFCGINLGEKSVKHHVSNMKPERKEKIISCQILIIDEISMLNVDFLIKCDQVIKKIRKNDEPFGGIQLILVGDFLQLPPVITGEKKKTYVPLFMHDFWKSLRLEYHFLRFNHRQSEDLVFANILSQMRMGKMSEEEFNKFKEMTKTNIKQPNSPRLFCKKAEAQKYNTSKLNDLDSEEKIITGHGLNEEKILQHLPVEKELRLKIGAQVILCSNLDVETGLFNGRQGKVVGFGEKSDPIVDFSNGQIVEVNKFKWEMKESISGRKTEKIVANFYQIPLILAWAITVHKTQGMTLDSAVVHGGFFEPGHAYVAFSRVKTLKGLHMENVRFAEIKTDKRVVDFYNKF